MFDQIGGLPVHILVIHAAVVFVPLLALGAIVYALVPGWRSKIGWAVISLAIIAPIVTFVSKESGEKLYDRQSASFKPKLDAHMHFGTNTFWYTLALGVVTLIVAIVTLRRPGALPRVVEIILGIVMIVLAVLSGYYVYRTGDSGAHVVWGSA